MKNTFLLTIFCSILFTNVFAQKSVFMPTEWNDPANEYYNRMSVTRQYQSANFVLWWGDLVGTNPTTATDVNLRFNPQSVADTFEYIYKRYITDLNFINNANTTNFGKYKTIVVILGTFSGNDDRTTGFAHASSYSNTIGAMFVHPAAIKDGGAISHEYAHALQMMMHIQENPGNGTAFAGYDWAGPFYEGHANFMRAQVYPKSTQIDGTLTRWIQTRHFMWSSNRHHYTNYNVLFYIQEKEGFDMTRRMWAESKNQEHPFETFKRLKGFTQEQLNDYLYNYCARDVAFDYSIQWNSTIQTANNFGKEMRSTYQFILNNLPRYTSRQYTLLTKVNGSTDRYYANDDWAPQDYGFNIIPLYPTCTTADKLVTIKFKGHTEVNSTYAGWRYGFVTTKADGTVSRYSPFYASADGEASFNLNTATESNIYLVVFAAPKVHSNYNMDVGFPKTRRFPYEIKISNAVPEGYQASVDFRKWRKTSGSIHANGGGWVASGASVASSVYVGPYAMVLGGNVTGNARIEDFATVQGGTVSGNAIVRGNAHIYNATVSDNAIVEGNAWMEGGTAYGTAQLKGNCMVWSASYGTGVVVGGDAEIGSCSTPGVYLQFPYWRNGRNECDGKGITDVSNIDINSTYTYFTDAQMSFINTPLCTASVPDCVGTPNGTATIDQCDRCVGGTTGKVACVSVNEAETIACSYDGTIDNNNLGYKGIGFINVPNAIGSKIVYRVQSINTGNKTVSIRYANGGSSNRPAQIIVNGSTQGQYNFAPTGAFTSYQTEEQSIPLTAGENIIQLVSTTANGIANVDQIGFVSSGLNAGNCTTTETLSINNSQSLVQIYPNPTKEFFTVQTATDVDIQVYDLNGKLMEAYYQTQHAMVGKDLHSGLYIVKINQKAFLVIKE